MIEDLLQEIVALENEQEAKVKLSVQEAKEIISKAKAQANSIQKDAEDKIKKLSADNIEKANKDCAEKCNKIICDANAQSENIIANAQKNSDKIVAYIIGRLESRYA